MRSAAQPVPAVPNRSYPGHVDDWFRWSSPAGIAMILIDIAACVLLIKYVPSL
jgi:hypothetical protein